MKKKTFTIEVKENTELMTFLMNNLSNLKKKTIKSLLKYKKIRVQGKIITQYNSILKPGMIVEVYYSKEQEQDDLKGIKIVYEDEQIIVIDKPCGLLSTAPDKKCDKLTAFGITRKYLQKKYKNQKLYIVHRLDRDASGLMMFVKNGMVQKKLRHNWYDMIDERSYMAVVEGTVKKDQGVVISWLHDEDETVISSKNKGEGKKAETSYKVIKRSDKYTLINAILATGRKHQIRVHMKDMGHRIAGDIKYGSKSDPIKRLALHAAILSFKHPVTGKKIRLESKAPVSFINLVK
ncbi:MAG: RluA family pseudouridine synthase [Spirochaetes bacterium]|nr:RluA family pseudouridine synthase [Spirochaetota bacterium]